MLGFVQKERLVNVRLRPKTHEEFKIACELRGASMSSLLHQFIVRTIREERDREPSAFNLIDLREEISSQRDEKGKIVGQITPGDRTITKADVRRMNGFEPEKQAAETKAQFHGAETIDFPKREIQLDDETTSTRDDSTIQQPRKRRGKR